MTDDTDDRPPTWVARLWEKASMPIAIGGLFAWFAMLWFMFGDVL